MAIAVTVSRIIPILDSIEVIVDFSGEESGPSYGSVSVLVVVEDRDWLLSDLKAEAIAKARAFLLRAASSR